MSRGFGGSARIVWQDENIVVYEYAPFNLNEPEYRNSEHVYDGRITISKDSMVEPEIHEKLKVMHSGKNKLIIKRLRRDVDFGACWTQEKSLLKTVVTAGIWLEQKRASV